MKLRSIESRDAQSLAALCQSEDMQRLPDSNYPQNAAQLESFIESLGALEDEHHQVIVSSEDELEGLVFLRHQAAADQSAELSVIVRESARSKGYAWQGLLEGLHLAFDRLNLERVYWCVEESNERAVRFFKKHGFNTLDEDIPEALAQRHTGRGRLLWFAVLRHDDYENVALSRKEICHCRIVKIKTVPTLEAGALSFFEGSKDLPFEIRRIYYISKVPEGARRGFHAHKQLKQLLFCPYGSIQLVLDDGAEGSQREEITLNDPSIGILIDRPVWREMLWLEKNSVLVVAASDYYTEADYLRDYTSFKNYIAKIRQD
ncbi:MAG: GNAT family N-acetyltransferase [Succinivibrio sp.]|nr:GNAT family N-acetyltransferase [Succinivibrio sp.]